MDHSLHVIWNPSAGTAGAGYEGRLREALGDDAVFTETSSADDAARAVRDAAPHAGVIVAAGGDGTINTVVNALMACPQRPPLGLLPMGTGNNLCRSLGVPLDPLEAAEAARGGRVRRVDVARVDFAGAQRYFVNTASGGNSDRVIECLRDEDKQRWGPWCYLRSALPLMTDLTAYEATVQLDEDPPQRLSLWNVVIANGAYAAGGLHVAPRAELDDGLLDVMLILDSTPLDLAGLAAEFFLGDYLEDPSVMYQRARSVRVEAAPELRFLVDGEMLTGQPFQFALEPRALDVVVPQDGAGAAEP